MVGMPLPFSEEKHFRGTQNHRSIYISKLFLQRLFYVCLFML